MPVHNLTREEAALRADTVSVLSYAVELTLDPEGDDFRSVTTVKFTAREGASTFIDAIAASVQSVTLNGVGLDVSDVVGEARIALPDLLESNVLIVDGRFSYMNTGEGLHRFVDPVDGETYLYSQFEVADSRRVFAVFEQPDLKASFAFSVTAPSHWTIVSNSPTPSAVDAEYGEGYRTWHFAPTPVVSCYITAVIAGPYRGATSTLVSSDGEEVPLGVYARASLAEYLDAAEIFDITRAGFAYYEAQFDQPYPFEKYDQVFVPEFNAGAMENAGAVTFTEAYVFRSRPTEAMVERRTVTILHELAHMWFGDLVTMRWWNDLWLNESFAEFMSTLATAEATRWTSAWTTFASLEKGWAYRQDQLPSTHPIVAPIRDLEDVEVNFDGITYAKGASVLKQLVAWVGIEQFMAGVRQYFDRHAWGNTELADLLRELEATSNRDLSEWSTLWLEESGVTVLRPEITSEDGTVTSLAITQEPMTLPEQAVPSLRPHRLRVGFYSTVDGVMRRQESIELDVVGPRTEVPQAAGLPVPEVLLVNDDDLAYAKIRLDDASMAAAQEKLSSFEDSLAQLLVWGAAWDMTRDGETRARDYIALVLGNLDGVRDSTGLLVQLRQLETTLSAYTAPADRERLTGEAAERLLALATAAEGGSDAQLQLVRAAARRATTPEQRAVVAGLLSGETELPGLEVDTDLRWDLLLALVTAGHFSPAEAEAAISAELERDNTAGGQRHAAAARAAVPTPEARRAAWDLMNGGTLPNATLDSVIAGWNRGDDALRAPFLTEYFDAIDGWWSRYTMEIAQRLVVGLYPAPTPEARDAAEAWLAAHPADAAPASLLRMMHESLDATRRSLRNQERDGS